ncbi:hypothetical protein AMS68_000163 [Peltaster fructicola]|uniref:Survival protein SurE-like phosphatase/nucleotidase domain-containing protein n=1 Tax=Peltaster fructicola TaxID=286661 RepID=A0A6H0XIV3_9PEZI|nr:hypothetical protein AMS68_000163 [Peltaster fructicola]
MHILLTNDDGPPSVQSSPYILPFVKALETAGHTVSVIVPNTQRSWIGKAHMVGQDVQATHYWPPETNPEVHTDSSSVGDNGKHPWVLVNSTPASCSQLGTSHFFEDRGPIDLVISGPNYGRNTSALFAMSSGTLGAALEACQCGYRSVALSFAFFDRKNDPEIVAESCDKSVKVAEWLAQNAPWGESVLYSVNVPVKKGVTDAKVHWTKVLQNTWTKGACFAEVSSSSADNPNSAEAKLRRQETGNESGTATPTRDRWATRHFKWSPRFTDVYQSVERAGPGWDGWVVKEGEVSVTALKANFMHADGYAGEIKL